VDGREQVTGFQMAGEMLGLDAISAEQTRLPCHRSGRQRSVPGAFSQLERLASQISLQHNLNKIMSREIVRDHSMLLQMGNMNADERLAAFVLNLSARMSRRGYSARSFVLRMRREEIGSYLGLRLETVCRSIAQLRKLGLVHISGRNVEILDLAQLKAFIAGCHRHGPE
jgi:CRP/FNR family transcriptional regulator